jgi:flagellar hook-associated protein 2
MPSNLFQINGLGSGVDTASILDALRAFKMRPVTLAQKQQDRFTTKQSVWQDINSKLLAFRTAADALSAPGAFSAVKGSSSDAALASVSAGPTAAPGNISLEVTQLAQARKLASATFTDAAAARGLTGDFTVNGKTVHVAESDSLIALAGKINALGAGASASVVQVTPGEYRLTVAGTSTGGVNALSLAQASGASSLAALGLLEGAGTTSTRYTATNASGVTAYSTAFASATAALGGVLGLGSAVTGSFTVNGAVIAYDTSTDTLNTLAEKINSAWRRRPVRHGRQRRHGRHRRRHAAPADHRGIRRRARVRRRRR